MSLPSLPQPGSESPSAGPFETYSASLAQRRLWFLNQLQGPTAAYNVYVGLWLYGPLHASILRTCLQEIVERHESLRTSFAFEHGELIQRVSPSHKFPLPLTDFSHFKEPHPPAYDLAKREVETPFDLSAGPLFRAHLMRISSEEHVLLCTMHHTVTDAWSLQVLTKELATLYKAASNGKKAVLPELPIQYGDFSEWQSRMLQSEKAQKQLQYWRKNLEGAPSMLQLPQDNPRPAEQTLQGNSQTYGVPARIMSELLRLSARYQITPFMFLLAAFKVLLYRYSGQSDVLVGVPVAGRAEIETESLIGFFVETVVLRDDLSGNPRFVDLLPKVRETTLGALANAEIPFEQIVEALSPERNLSCNPIFQVMFSVIKSAIQSHDFGNVAAFPYVVNSSTSILDLFATFIEDSDGKWWVQIDFNTVLFRVERIARMVDDLIAVLETVTKNPQIRIDDIPVSCGKQPLMAGECLSRKPEPDRESNQQSVTLAQRRIQEIADAAESEQELLVEIWKDLLGTSKIGTHDNFFDMGGHSLLAARLTAQIQEVTGRTLPVSAIFRAPTIAGLASMLRHNALSQPDPLVMQLRQGDSEARLFAVAAPGVDSLGYALLARHLAGEESMCKLQAPGSAVWDRPFEKDELRGLAQQYLSAMRSVQPAGPFCFVAMCDGVLIAQEMILQLESVGEEVGFLAVLDTWVLENSQIRFLWATDYYRRRMRTFRGLPLRQQLATMRQSFKRLTGRKGARGKWTNAYWPGKTFAPPMFRAPVLLFKRPKQPYFYVHDQEMGWGARSLGGVEICEIHCGHFEILRQPHVGLIAQKLSERLRKLNKPAETRLTLPEIHVANAVPSDLADPLFE